MVDVKAEELLAEHAAGDSLRVIAKRHGVGHETVRRVILQTGSALIRDLEGDLLAAELKRDKGLEPIWPACVIPPQMQADRMDALEMFGWAVKRLRERHWAIEIVTRQVPGGGVVFMLTTTPGRST